MKITYFLEDPALNASMIKSLRAALDFFFRPTWNVNFDVACYFCGDMRTEGVRVKE